MSRPDLMATLGLPPLAPAASASQPAGLTNSNPGSPVSASASASGFAPPTSILQTARSRSASQGSHHSANREQGQQRSQPQFEEHDDDTTDRHQLEQHQQHSGSQYNQRSSSAAPSSGHNASGVYDQQQPQQAQQQPAPQPQGEGQLPSSVLPPQLLPSFFDAAPDTAQSDRVLWFGNVDKVGKGLGAHRRAAFVTSSSVILALPTGGVTRVMALDAVGAATVIPPNVVKFEEPGKHDLILCCADPAARDALVGSVKTARKAKFPHARPLNIKEEGTLRLGADMTVPPAAIGRPVDAESLQPEHPGSNNGQPPDQVAFGQTGLSNLLGSLRSGGNNNNINNSNANQTPGMNFSEISPGRSHSVGSGVPSASQSRHASPANQQHQQQQPQMHRPGSAASFLGNMFPGSQQQQQNQQQNQQPTASGAFGNVHYNPADDNSPSNPNNNQQGGIPSAGGLHPPSYAQVQHALPNPHQHHQHHHQPHHPHQMQPSFLQPQPPPSASNPQTVPLSQVMQYGNDHGQPNAGLELSHLYPPAAANPEKPMSAPRLGGTQQQPLSASALPQTPQGPTFGEIMGGGNQQQPQQQPQDPNAQMMQHHHHHHHHHHHQQQQQPYYYPQQFPYQQQYNPALMHNQQLQQQIAVSQPPPTVLFANQQPGMNNNNNNTSSRSPSFSPASPVPGTSRQLEIAAAAVAMSEHGKQQEKLNSLEEQMAQQARIIESMRQDRAHAENTEIKEELQHARALIADLQTALKSQESTFAEMLRSQEMLRLSEEARSQKDRELTVLRNDRENLQRQLREKEAAISDLRDAMHRVEQKGHAELERVRQAFVDYDKNVGEYVEKMRLQHLEEMEALRKRLVAEQELNYQQQHQHHRSSNSNPTTPRGGGGAGASRQPIKVHTPPPGSHTFYAQSAAAAASGRDRGAVDPEELRSALLNLAGVPSSSGYGGGGGGGGPPTSFHPSSPMPSRDVLLNALSPSYDQQQHQLTGRAAELARGYPSYVVNAAREHLLTENPVPPVTTPANLSRRDRSIL